MLSQGQFKFVGFVFSQKSVIDKDARQLIMNAFMQQKIAIVTPRPQTTRTRQLGIITEPDYQMIFVDTPGIIKEPRHKLDEYMLESAEEML